MNPYLGTKDEFIEKNLKLVHMVVRKYFLKVTQNVGLSYDDLFSEGCIGLVTAYNKYDPTKFDGKVTKFSTYAVPMIMGQIRRFIREKGSLIRTPRAIFDILSRVLKMHNEGISIEEIADELNCDSRAVQDAIEYANKSAPIALDQPINQKDNEKISIMDTVGQNQDLSGIFVQELLESLSDQERMIVELRAKGYLQNEIGQKVGLSQVQISRILERIKNRWQGNDYVQPALKTHEKVANPIEEMSAMIDEAIANGQKFRKGDVIRIGDAADTERIYLVGFETDKQIAYGLKLTRECNLDSRCKVNEHGWNVTVSFQHLTRSKILLRDLTLDDIKAGKAIEAGKKEERSDSVKTRTATPEEMKKHGIKTILDEVDWFTDVKLPTVPTISLNTQGISFNAAAMEEMDLEVGEALEVGFLSSQMLLVFKKSERGVKLKKAKERKALLIVNKRLVDWLNTKDIKPKRYALEKDKLSGAWIAKLEVATGSDHQTGAA